MTQSLWISYAWVDNEEGDFTHLVHQLTTAGVSARFDKVALIPGRRLWEQIAGQIAHPDLAGWASLLTPKSIASQPCREELAYALDRALQSRGQEFPLIGLLHRVPIAEVPPALRIRLCVDLGSPNWIEEVRASLEGRPPTVPVHPTTDIKVRVHSPYLGDPELQAIEFSPRFGETTYWRIAYPDDGPIPISKGTGPANGGGVAGAHFSVVEGSVIVDNRQMKFFGASNSITPSISAYFVFRKEIPKTVAFARSTEPYGVPTDWVVFRLQRP